MTEEASRGRLGSGPTSRRRGAALVCVGLLAGSPALAGVSDARAGLLLGDEFRYDRMSLPLRTLADLVAIPANAPLWTDRDWTMLLATSTAVVALMAPQGRSPDVLLQGWVHENVGAWRQLVWTPATEVVVWSLIAGGMGWSFLSGEQELVSLMAESFAVAQLYQFVFKLSIGREGPMNGEGLGIIHGPKASLGLFPAGTPSGHAASFFALMGALQAYRQSPELTAVAMVSGLVFGASLVVSDYHFVSDVVWGATMGFAIGNWVVSQRGTFPGRGGRGPGSWPLTPLLEVREDRWTVRLAGAF